MNLKIKKRIAEKQCSRAEITRLATKFGVNEKLIELLNQRGLSDEQEISRFLYPDIANFYDPFLMKDMKVAVERINQAIENRERVVVYGDYDADGICATAILSLYLASRGVEVYSHIPNRVDDGYGLNFDSIDKIIDNCLPDLIITCDCGISAHKEVEYVQDLGVDIIVTDHHEVSSIVPKCPVVNPHQTDCAYPFKNLCGAGVTLKLIQAISDDICDEYLEIAAIATIADLVPLLDENRIIVKTGLDRLSLNRNLGIKSLLINQNLVGKVSSADIAYKIAPRINAAGRMGDAYRAFILLTSNDPVTVNSIINEINEDNNRRKELCDKLYNEALLQLSKRDFSSERCIVLTHPDWEKGITGIVAARLAGEFKRISVILVKSGDSYKGTARSVDGINLYDMLSSVEDILCEYGGHSQAAGFSILEQNIPEFKRRMNEYLKNYDDHYFLPSIEYDLDMDASMIDKNLFESLDMIEPTGNGNTKPLIRVEATNLQYMPFRNNSQHYSVQIPDTNFSIFAFNFASSVQFLSGDNNKSLVLELQTSNASDGVKGILRGISSEEFCINDERARANFLKYLSLKSSAQPIFDQYDANDKLAFVELVGRNIYGTLIVCGCRSTYEKWSAHMDLPSVVLREQITPSYKNNYTRLIVSPDWDELLLSSYNKIIFLDSPPSNNLISYLNKRTSAKIYLPKENNFNEFVSHINTSRECFIGYYKLISRNTHSANSIFSYYKNLKHSADFAINLPQFVACLVVFIDLGIIQVEKERFSINVVNNVKVNLTDSDIYNSLVNYGSIKRKV